MFSLHNGDALVLSPSSPLTQHLRETHMRGTSGHTISGSQFPTTRVATEMTIFTKTYTNIKLRFSETREKNNAGKYFVKC
jgi:hypothetical protein